MEEIFNVEGKEFVNVTQLAGNGPAMNCNLPLQQMFTTGLWKTRYTRMKKKMVPREKTTAVHIYFIKVLAQSEREKSGQKTKSIFLNIH